MSGPVVVITRLETQNAGNEALSKELLIYADKLFGKSNIRMIDRYPRVFESFYLTDMGSQPEAAFDALARRMIEKYAVADVAAAPEASPDRVRLQKSTREVRGRLRQVKNWIGIRKRLASMGLIEVRDAEVAISACAGAGLLLWNPAGEIHPTGNRDQIMRLLLLVRISQLSGRRTAVVNHSLEVVDPLLQRLIRHVYSAMDYVGVRDLQSVGRAREVAGVQAIEAPDVVFLASRNPASRNPAGRDQGGGAIGISINGLTADRTTGEWDSLMAGLAKQQRPFLYLSNAMNHDIEFGRWLANRYGGEVFSYQPGYLELRTHYAKCDVLISSRLHASILALCEATPVVSIEPSVFKLTAIFEQMRYPIKTVSMDHPGWGTQVLDNALRALAEKTELAAFGHQALSEQRDRIGRGYRPLVDLWRSASARQG